jgi:hypothetical protein
MLVRLAIVAALPAMAGAQTVPAVPNLDAARAAARQVDQAAQVPRTGKESMDRTAPLLTVEPHKDPASGADEAAWREKKEAEAKKALEASPPK